MTLPTRPNLGQALLEGLRRPMPPHVSLKGNRFTLVDAAGRTEPVETFDPKAGPYLDCVICDVNAKVSRIFYADAYDADNPGPPDCFSDNGVAPSVNASEPQAARCDICPQAEWGSATSNLTGKGIPACRSYKKLAVLLEKYPGMVFMIAIPPASLNAVGDYAKVCNGYKVDVMDVLTRISFMPDKMGILVFEPKDHASEEMKARVNKVWENPDGAGHIIGRFDQPRQAAIEHKPAQPEAPLTPFGESQLAAPATASPFTSGNMQQAAQKEPKKPRGRPRTVVDAPKNSLTSAQQNPFGSAPQQGAAFGAAAQQPSAPASASSPTNGQAEQGKFGVVENPPAPDAGMGKVLDNLFGTKFE